MSNKWTPEKVRGWLLELLYDTYMESPTAFPNWSTSGREQSKGEPSGSDIHRESEWLINKGLIDADIKATSVVQARITGTGRNFVEDVLRGDREPERDILKEISKP